MSALKITEGPGSQLLLLRFSGDLTTKAPPTRRRMTSRLVENLRTVIRASGRKARVLRDRNRIFVDLESIPPSAEGVSDAELAKRLARVFGIQSVSISHSESWRTLDDVIRAGTTFGAPHVPGRRFAIRARRVGDRGGPKLSSSAIERVLGAALLPLAAGVDLSNPEVTIFVETDPERAYYFAASEEGVGGLPLGSGGRAISLLSGGFDSPVASWRMLRRGIALDYVFCNLGGRAHQLEAMTVAKRLCELWQAGTQPRFHAIDFDHVSREIQAKVKMRFWQVVLKRQMLRAGEAVAGSFEASAIVTGDAIGQVSSQTLQNLGVVSEATRLPILRPLVGHGKDEIIAESRIVGTHALSKKVGEYCAIVPSRPATHARLDEVLDEEKRLDAGILEQALADRSEFRLDEIDLEAWQGHELAASEVITRDTVIDLRSKAAFGEWHFPDALSLEFPQALNAYGAFDPDQRYVLYCEYGLKSAHLADLMRRAGLDARHLSGGLREAKRLTSELADRAGPGGPS